MQQAITVQPTEPTGVRGPAHPVIPYEERMNRNSRWAMSEASEFFEGKGSVQTALRDITSRLNFLGVPYAVAGGMAMFYQGFRRYTEDVDILVTRTGLELIHEKLEGLGYVPAFVGSKNLLDAENGVRIEFLVAGEYPGDGKPKPVVFPDPAEFFVVIDGISYLILDKIIELKLASGIANNRRMKDLANVQEFIKILNLGQGFEQNLHPFVRAEFTRLWRNTRPAPTTRFLILLPGQPTNFEELFAEYPAESDKFRAMRADGVTLEPRGKQVFLVTADHDLALKYEMHDESEFMETI